MTAPSFPLLLPFTSPCITGSILRREKRFSVAFTYQGEELWSHTNNSGSMMGLIRKGRPALFSVAANPQRKLPYTLEMVGLPQEDGNPMWVGVNTMVPNKLLKAAFTAKALFWAEGYTRFTAEAPLGNSRIDALLQGDGLPDLWVECKNVTLVEDGVAAFPDAVSTRAQKHLATLAERVEAGHRAAFFYCIQRPDAHCFAPADYVDPTYAQLFYDTLALGVEAYAHMTPATPEGICLGHTVPLLPLSV